MNATARDTADEPGDAPAEPPRVVRWRRAVVLGLRSAWRGAAELEVRISDPDGSTRTARALCYPALTGVPSAGQEVLLNTTALDRGLGTGGYALVVAPGGPLPADPPPAPGHLVKARYTPLQPMLLGVDDQECEHHETMAAAEDLDAMPVVVADLHSALPAILAGVRERGPGLRVAYAMTDGGALPLWFSKAVAGLREAGWLCGAISVGQAFGGDLEAVTLHSGLLAARHVLGADVCVVAQGPGNLGTGTPFGFSGVAVGEAVNAIDLLGGRAVACLRVSGADPRERHLGVSHHSLTAYGRVALRPADVVVPELDEVDPALARRVRAQAAALAECPAGHRMVSMDVTGLDEVLASSPVRLSTMGRGLVEDPAAFLAAAAAGRHAGDLALARTRSPGGGAHQNRNGT
ncbi:MAG: DUF3866 family protein [Actinomycetales bacterium]